MSRKIKKKTHLLQFTDCIQQKYNNICNYQTHSVCPKYAKNTFVAGAPSRTHLQEFTEPPRLLAGLKGLLRGKGKGKDRREGREKGKGQ